MFKEFLKKLSEGKNLTREEASAAMAMIMEGEATPAQIASFLTAMKLKGETVEELTGIAETMRARAMKLNAGDGAIDTCGTGGDGAKTFNVSTGAAIVAAAGGVPVVKHGNRSVSSRSGSADVLEQLNIPIQLEPLQAERMLKATGLCFLFAPLYNPAMKHAVGPRKEIGFRTMMNLLGPLTNPAGVTRQVIGVFDFRYARRLAKVLRELGSRHVLFVHSEDGLDEISVSSPTRAVELRDGEIREFAIVPEELGLSRYPRGSYSTGTPAENARTIESVLSGNVNADYEIVLANAGAAFYVAGKVSSLREGVEAAREIIKKGDALKQLRLLQHYGKEVLHA